MVERAQVRVISDAIVGEIISLAEVVALIDGAFADDARGTNRNFSVVRERLAPAHDGIFGIKSGIAGQTLGLKAGGFWGGNRGRGVPPHQSTMVLFNPDSGQAVSLIGANRVTGLRTGAAGAVAAKHLARANADTVALIGCGAQGLMQIRALAQTRKLARVSVWDRLPEASAALAGTLSAELGVNIEVVTHPEQAVRAAGIVITATPGESPVLEAAWVSPGQHINAIGSDTAGKREVDTSILLQSTLVVDNRAQALTLGESQHLKGLVEHPESRIHAELGEVILGTRPGRQTAEEITFFDATGVTFQDLVVAAEIHRRCEEQNLGVVVEI